MGPDLYDCPWCGSAKSVEHGLCQVCLHEFDEDAKIIRLPARRSLHGHPAATRSVGDLLPPGASANGRFGWPSERPSIAGPAGDAAPSAPIAD